MLNTLSIKENESLLPRSSYSSLIGCVSLLPNYSVLQRKFHATSKEENFYASEYRETERREGSWRRIRRGSNVAPLVSPCKAGYVGQVSRGPEARPKEMRRQTHSSLQPKRSPVTALRLPRLYSRFNLSPRGTSHRHARASLTPLPSSFTLSLPSLHLSFRPTLSNLECSDEIIDSFAFKVEISARTKLVIGGLKWKTVAHPFVSRLQILPY